MIDLYAYADESGIQDAAKYCLVAGYIASRNQWAQFRHEWQDALKEFGVSAFHAKDFFSGHAYGHYKDWSNDKSEQFVFGLGEVAKMRRLHPIGCAINVPDFFKFTIGERRFLTGGVWDAQKGAFTSSGKPSAPYFAAFQYFVRAALLRTPGKARLHLVFDRQNVMKPKAQEIFSEMVRLPFLMPGSEKLGDIEFHISSEDSPLQLADLYTHGWYDYCTRGKSGNFTMRIAMTQLTQKHREFGIFDAKGIDDNLGKHLGEQRARIREQD